MAVASASRRRAARVARSATRSATRILVCMVAALVATVAACDDGGAGAGAVDGPADGALLPRELTTVEIAALADSTVAGRLRDSLEAAGWRPVLLRRVAGDSLPPWRVRLVPPGEQLLGQIVAANLRLGGRTVRMVRDTAVPRAHVVLPRAVNTGSRGAISRLRWATGPDRRALLAVENATAIENEPMPDGFLLADERGPVVIQRDSVWDVAPDPAWQRVAYGRAFLIPAEGRDSIAIRQWAAVAGRTNLDIETVRREAFPASSMNALFGFAQPVIEAIDPDSAAMSGLMRQVSTPVPMAGGWRLRWSTDGRHLAVALPPARRARDDSPPRVWLQVDPESHLLRGGIPPYVTLASVDWTAGPVFDVSVPTPTSAAPIPITGGQIATRGGWIVARGRLTGGEPLVVGPGVALAATAGGRFVLAVVPEPGAAEGTPRARPVVYQIGDR